MLKITTQAITREGQRNNQLDNYAKVTHTRTI